MDIHTIVDTQTTEKTNSYSEIITYYLFCLKREITNESKFLRFFESLRQLVHSSKPISEYSNVLRSFIPGNAESVVNKLIASIDESMKLKTEFVAELKKALDNLRTQFIPNSTSASSHPSTVIPFPPLPPYIPMNPSTQSLGKQRAPLPSKIRKRKEWTPAEERLFLAGLQNNKLDFMAIGKLLPHRSRSQIRAHYRYLAKNFKQENCNIRCKGGSKLFSSPASASLMMEMKKCIESIESSRSNPVSSSSPSM